MRRSIYIFLTITLFGLLTSLSVFPYYWFELGVKSCKGLPTDTVNCGDADFGGVSILLVGLPIFAIGIAGLLYCFIKHHIVKYRSHQAVQ